MEPWHFMQHDGVYVWDEHLTVRRRSNPKGVDWAEADKLWIRLPAEPVQCAEIFASCQDEEQNGPHFGCEFHIYPSDYFVSTDGPFDGDQRASLWWD
jgi:hypothetical protein